MENINRYISEAIEAKILKLLQLVGTCAGKAPYKFRQLSNWSDGQVINLISPGASPAVTRLTGVADPRSPGTDGWNGRI